MLIWIVMPLIMFSLELHHVNHYKTKLSTASEIAMMDMMLAVEPHQYSERALQLPPQINEVYKDILVQKLKLHHIYNDVQSLIVKESKDNQNHVLHVSFEMDYDPLFLPRSLSSKRVSVDFHYQVGILSGGKY